MADKIDSNITGLRYAEEASLRTLPGSPVWYPLEPNSYSDFGGQISTIARDPINPSRQRKKGVTTDLDADGGFSQDLTYSNLTRLLQGFFFADIREKATTLPMNGAQIPITGVTALGDDYAAASGLDAFIVNNIVLASGFTVAANNGLKVVTTAAAALLNVAEALEDETPTTAATLECVGYQFDSATLDVVMNGTLCTLSRASGVVDYTTLGLIPGEWVYLGGDAANTYFANNQGFARILSVTADTITLDKTSWTGVNETGTGLTVQMFYGNVIKNEDDPNLIVRRTYNVERTLGDDANGTMSEYLVGAVANEMTLNIPQADKIMIDLSFVAVDNEQRDGLTGVKSGTRPNNVVEDAFNTSSDFSRIKLGVYNGLDAAPTPLFAYLTELTLTLNNNVSPNKAVGVLGAFDTTAGAFEIGGSMTAYFATIEAVQAVRDNEDVTIDVVIAKDNQGLIFDIPLLSLGNGRLNVEKDQPIMVPLDMLGAESVFNHTLLFNSFPYLPDAAE